jgi:hypothetical protein
MPKAPRIDGAFFGSLLIDGRKYNNDVIVSWNGEIKDRPSSHDFTNAEMDSILMNDPDVVVIGTGHSGMVKVAHDVDVSARLKGVELVVKPTVQAMQEYNKFARLGKHVVAVLHATC